MDALNEVRRIIAEMYSYEMMQSRMKPGVITIDSALFDRLEGEYSDDLYFNHSDFGDSVLVEGVKIDRGTAGQEPFMARQTEFGSYFI